MDRKAHWEDVYTRKKPNEVSWFQAQPSLSLGLVTEAAGAGSASIIDVGGGASSLVDRLVNRPKVEITVLDLSGVALAAAQSRLGPAAGRVKWIEADILDAELPKAGYDVWHDRAVFHFLTSPDDRRRYVAQVRRSVRVGGHVLVATFALDGPHKCSGLDVARYSPTELHAQFGDEFRLLKSVSEDHVTPMGTVQKFVYCMCSVEGPRVAHQAA